MPLNLFLTFDVESIRPGDCVTCKHVPDAPGSWLGQNASGHGRSEPLVVTGTERPTIYGRASMFDRPSDRRGKRPPRSIVF
jgi:hypothetical protein